MKSVKVWQVSLKFDEQSFFKTRILQQRLSCYYSSYQYYNYCPYHSKCPHDCLDMRTPISPDHRSVRTLESHQQWTLSDCWIWTAVTFISLTKCRPALKLGGCFLDVKTRHQPLLPLLLFVCLAARDCSPACELTLESEHISSPGRRRAGIWILSAPRTAAR